MTQILLLVLLLLPSPAGGRAVTNAVIPGADVLIEKRLDLLRGKRVGLITNHTGRLSSGEFLLDALIARGVAVTALFGPEHGIRGTEDAGDPVADSVDAKTRIPVYSLYGRIRKPTPAMLGNVDVLVYDMQDVGARFYTYLSTMGRCMESAAEKGIPFVVLDRPDPLGGILTDGPVIPDSLRSFVGMFPIPVIYGLTVGELAAMANGEGWLAGGVHADLIVVPMEGWKRKMLWEDTGLPWVPPSPNIRSPRAALVYPATCYLEATNVSEGRGTEDPFQVIGAPFINGAKLAAGISALHLPGVTAAEIRFTPGSSKFKGSACSGIRLEFSMSDSLRPVLAGLHILSTLSAEYRDSLIVNGRGLSRLLGDPGALDLMRSGADPAFIAGRWEARRREFSTKSSAYRIYPTE